MKAWHKICFVSTVVVVVIFILLALAACDGDGRTVPSSRSGITGIASGSDGVRTGWFAYSNAFGDIIEQPGIRMEVTTSNPSYLVWSGVNGWIAYPAPGTQSIHASGVTGHGGRMIATGQRDDQWLTYEPYTISNNATVRPPRNPGIQGIFTYRTRATPRSEVAFSGGSGQPIPLAAATSPPHAGCMANLTEDEFCAVTNETESPPETGFATSKIGLVVQDGDIGKGYTRRLNQVIAINLECPDLVARYSSPMQFSVLFKTAEPAHFAGMSLMGNVRTNACPDGIDVEIHVVSSGIDLMTHVARTDYFLPVDSELPIAGEEFLVVYDRWTAFDCDPNDYDCIRAFDTSDPDFYDAAIPERFMSVKVIPLGAENDALRFDMSLNNARTMMAVIDHWLSDNRVFDMNGDGIVNFEDLIFLLE